jgi:hypothetical protein
MKRRPRPTVAGSITAATADGLELAGTWYAYAPGATFATLRQYLVGHRHTLTLDAAGRVCDLRLTEFPNEPPVPGRQARLFLVTRDGASE